MDLFDLSSLRLNEFLAADYYLNAVDGCSIASRPKFELLMDSKFPYELLNADAITQWGAGVGRASIVGTGCQVMHPNMIIGAFRGITPENRTEENRNQLLRLFLDGFRVRPDAIRGGVAVTNKKIIGFCFEYQGIIAARFDLVAENDAWKQLVPAQCNETQMVGINEVVPPVTLGQAKNALRAAAGVAFDIELELKPVATIEPEYQVFVETFDRDSWKVEGLY